MIGWDDIKEGYEKFNRAFVKAQFTAEVRADFYDQVTMLYSNGVPLEEALKRIWVSAARAKDVDTKDDGSGKDWIVVADEKVKTSNPTANVAMDCIKTLKAGENFSKALTHWVDPQEVSLIASGEDGDLTAAFARVVKTMQRRSELLAGVIVPLVMPFFLFLMIAFLLTFGAFSFAPQLLQLAPLEKWQGLTAVYLHIEVFIGNWWWAALILIGGVVGSFAVSLPRWRGSDRDWEEINQLSSLDADYALPMTTRAKVDRYAPYSIYRIYLGSIFLNGLVQAQGQGIKLGDSLVTARNFASPWLAERCDDISWAVAKGNKLGKALELAGHEFPDKQTIQFIQVLEDVDPTGAALDAFTDKWIKRNIRQIAGQAMLVRVIAMAAGGLCLALMYGAIYGIQQISHIH